MCGDYEVEYFLENGWELVASAPNPDPMPFIVFIVSKFLEKKLTKDEKNDLLIKARAKV